MRVAYREPLNNKVEVVEAYGLHFYPKDIVEYLWNEDCYVAGDCAFVHVVETDDIVIPVNQGDCPVPGGKSFDYDDAALQLVRDGYLDLSDSYGFEDLGRVDDYDDYDDDIDCDDEAIE